MKMNIVVDCDELLLGFVDKLILFHNDRYGTSLVKEDFTSYNFHEIWGGTIPEETRKVAEFYDSEYFREIEPIKGAQEAMGLIKRKGHTLFVGTGRAHFLKEKTVSDIEKYYSGIFSGIYFANTYGESGVKTKKSVICRKLNARLIIEDDPLHINDCAGADISVLAYNYPWNQVVLPEKVFRFFDWEQAICFIDDFVF